MKFRLNYQVFRETTLKPKNIIQNIAAELDDKKYDIVSVTGSTVEFSTNPWGLGWSFEPTQLDGGTFIINPSDIGANISLRYYFNILPNVLIMTVMAIGLSAQGAYEGILFFLAFFLITGVIHIFTLKNKAKRLLRDITDSDNQDDVAG